MYYLQLCTSRFQWKHFTKFRTFEAHENPYGWTATRLDEITTAITGARGNGTRVLLFFKGCIDQADEKVGTM